jgi:2-C-methyl-D-erythritol 2,4-cyclodiphosphate synthase
MTLPPVPVRTGWGFDAHRFGGPPPLRLGGVVVSEELGVVATSDGDVLAHAITDALLGAAVLGDMGTHFPSDDPRFRGADSMGLLARAVAMVDEAGWAVDHVDTTVICEAVRVSPHREEIRQSIAAVMGTGPDRISVKATTTDGLGALGEGSGVAAVAVVTIGVPR